MSNDCDGRRTYWSEIDSNAKIERLREEVKKLTREASNLVLKMYKMENHAHVANGNAVVSLTYSRGCGLNTPHQDGDDVYI